MDRRDHWDQVYRTRAPERVGWYQRRPDISLALIAASGVRRDAGVVDVGGGASVLDLSGAALSLSRSRLGARAAAIEWFEADVTSFEPPHRYGLWHDRAVFHFLTDAKDRAAYLATLCKTLQPNGAVIIATFALEAPPKCSGLDVVRYDEHSITAELGDEFQLCEVRQETHMTPWQAKQQFNYFRFQRAAT